MPSNRNLLAALTVAGFALVPASAMAQQSKEAAKADVATWTSSLGQAFSPGFWEGEMKELDAQGNVVKSENKPDCIKAGEGNQLSNSLGEMFTMMIDKADCTTTSGGTGSIDLKMVCAVPGGGKQMTFISSGNYSEGLVNWDFKFNASGEGAPEARSITLVARRTKTTCS